MKKTNLLTAATLCMAIAFTSCSKSDSVECHECHIAFDGPDGEIEVEIGEFCGTALEDAELNGHTLSEDVIIGNDTIVAGFYPGDDIHCEDHADD